MNLNELNNEIKNAMKSGDNIRRDTLRSVLNEVKNEEIAKKTDANEEMINAAIKKVLKQTSETLENSIKADNNQERTNRLAVQVDVLESILPPMLSNEELKNTISDIISENGFSSMKDTGSIMKILKEKTNNCFDGKEASSFIKEIFN